MRCKECGNWNSKILQTKMTMEGNVNRRRRSCLDCGKRFTTYEMTADMYYEEHDEVSILMEIGDRNDKTENVLVEKVKEYKDKHQKT